MYNKKIVYVGFAFGHHGMYSGYNQIRDYVGYDKIIDCQKNFERLDSFRKNRNILTRLYFKLFGSRLWMVELKLIQLSLRYPEQYIFHIIYGENIYKYLGFFKRKNQIVLTLHQPPSYFDKNEKVRIRPLIHVDKLIVMSKEMEDYFRRKFPTKPTLFIPHGVNTDYFRPTGKKQNQVLMIGNWLRDFAFASNFFNLVKESSPEIEIIVLTSEKNHFHFSNSLIKLLSKITDDELLKLYQASKILFLPLTSFTANNALLEACSTGCQVIICTDKSNHISDPNSPVQFIEKDVNIAYMEIGRILTDYSSKKEATNREYVKNNYDWKKIGMLTNEFLKS
jgi:glycosyltransferase involved in cell wall biosynthesis